MIRHLVFLNYQDSTTAQTRQDILRDLATLKTRIGGIRDFQHRPNLSPEEAVIHGFRDMFWFDFEDEKARDRYLEDEHHRAIGARIVMATEGGTSGVFVCDIKLADY